MFNFISVSEIVGSCLLSPIKPHALFSGSSIKELLLYYSYGNDARLNLPLFEFNIAQGQIIKRARSENSQYDWYLQLELVNQFDLEGLKKLDNAVSQHANKFKTHKNSHQVDSCFKLITDKNTGSVIPELPPYILLKLNQSSKFRQLIPKVNNYGEIKINKKTNQPIYNEKIVDYNSLENKIITCSVIFCAKSLTINTSSVVMRKMVHSCMFWNVREIGDIPHYKSKILSSFLSNNPQTLIPWVQPVTLHCVDPEDDDCVDPEDEDCVDQEDDDCVDQEDPGNLVKTDHKKYRPIGIGVKALDDVFDLLRDL